MAGILGKKAASIEGYNYSQAMKASGLTWDEKTLDAIRLCARLEGMLTDPVYEGKSMAALIDLIRSERVEPGSKVLYAHLGGQPAMNAYAGAF